MLPSVDGSKIFGFALSWLWWWEQGCVCIFFGLLFCIYLSKEGLVLKVLFHFLPFKSDCLGVKYPLQLWWEALRFKECLHLVCVHCDGCKIVQACLLFMKLLPARCFLYGDLDCSVAGLCAGLAGSVDRSESPGCCVSAGSGHLHCGG